MVTDHFFLGWFSVDWLFWTRTQRLLTSNDKYNLLIIIGTIIIAIIHLEVLKNAPIIYYGIFLTLFFTWNKLESSIFLIFNSIGLIFYYYYWIDKQIIKEGKKLHNKLLYSIWIMILEPFIISNTLLIHINIFSSHLLPIIFFLSSSL